MSETQPEGQHPDTSISESADSADAPSGDVRNISIQQSFHHHQIDVLLPGIVGSFVTLAESNPELASKMFDLLDEQRSHRQQMDNIVTRGDERRSYRAQILSWLFAMTALIGAIWLISINQPTEGIVIVVVAVAPLISFNIIGFRSARMERIQKAKLLVDK